MTPEVPGLAQTQLHQAGQAMLHGLPEGEIGCESRTVLERAPGFGTWLTGVAIPIGDIRNGRRVRRPGVLFTLGHQLQRALGVRGIAGHCRASLPRR